MKRKVKRCKVGTINYPLFFKCCFALLTLWITSASLYMVVHIYPETTMVLNSKCENPVQSWDGKLFGIPIWHNSLRARPRYFNLHYELEYFDTQIDNLTKPNSFLRKLESKKVAKAIHQKSPSKKPLIIWGSHHKTGTFVAQKIFSKICTMMSWCCKFHVTRDSVYAVQHSLQEDVINVIAHNQWIWNPQKDFNLNNFYFFHFYRHPWKKIISSYKYHYAGSEKWNKKILNYSKICSQANVLINASSAASFSIQQSAPFRHLLRDQIYDYCHSIQLCESCCRKEHEKNEIEIEKGYFTSKKVKRTKTINSTGTSATSRDVANTTDQHYLDNSFIPPAKIEYNLRSIQEYEFMCNTLGQIPPNVSLQQYLVQHSVVEGLLVEAGLNYFEILRMIKLLFLTNSNDSKYINRVKHVDLDSLSKQYDSISRDLISELSDLIPSVTQRNEIHSAIQFYDLKNSPLYHWSMSKHVTSKSPSSSLVEYNFNSTQYGSRFTTENSEMLYWEILDTHPIIQSMYRPIFAMLSKL